MIGSLAVCAIDPFLFQRPQKDRVQYPLSLGQTAGSVQIIESPELLVLGASVKEWGLEIDLLTMLPGVPVGVTEAVVYDAQLIPAQGGRPPGVQRAVCVPTSYRGVNGAVRAERHLNLGQAADCVQMDESPGLPVLEALMKEWRLEIDHPMMLPGVPVGVMEAAA